MVLTPPVCCQGRTSRTTSPASRARLADAGRLCTEPELGRPHHCCNGSTASPARAPVTDSEEIRRPGVAAQVTMEIDDGIFWRIDHRMNPAVTAKTIKLATGPTTSPGSR